MGVGRLHEREPAGRGIDRERRRRVLLAAKGLVVAVGRVDKVARDPHLGRLGPGRRGFARWVGGRRLDLAEAEAAARAGRRGRHRPGRHGSRELVDDVEVQGARGRLPELAVAGPVACPRGGSGAVGEFAGRGVDAEDADQVRAQVRAQQEPSGRVGEDGVRVRLVLAVGVWSGGGHVEGELLDLLGACGQGQLVGCYGRGVTVSMVRLPIFSSEHARGLTIQPQQRILSHHCLRTASCTLRHHSLAQC